MATVLIVDDELEIVEFLRNFLRRKQTSVKVATDGDSALRIFREQKPDLTLLDIGMPKLDGLQLLKIMRKLRPEAAIVMVTGREDKIAIDKANKLGACDYIVKPLELDKLHSVVCQYLKEPG